MPKVDSHKILYTLLFLKEDFVYSYNPRGTLWLIFHALFSIPIIIMFAEITIMHLNTFFTIIPLSFLLIFILLVILHFFINRNYIRNSLGKTIKVSSGSELVTITENNQKKDFNKSDIKQVIFYEAAGNRNPYGFYGFSKIVLKNDEVFNITHMLIEPWLLKFKLKAVPVKMVYKFYPYVK